MPDGGRRGCRPGRPRRERAEDERVRAEARGGRQRCGEPPRLRTKRRRAQRGAGGRRIARAARRWRASTTSSAASSRSCSRRTSRSRRPSARCATCAPRSPTSRRCRRQDFDDVSARLKAAQAALTEGAGAARRRRVAASGPTSASRSSSAQRWRRSRRSRIPKRSRAEVRDLQQQWRQAADVPRAQGDALWRRFKAAHDEAWARCEAHFAAQASERAREPREEGGAVRAGRGARPIDQLDANRRRDQGAAGRVEDHRPGDAGPGEGDLGAVPRRLRSVLHPAPRRSRRAKDGLGRELREEGSAVRQGRGAGRRRPTGTRAAAEIKRLQAEWKTIGPGEEEPVGGDLAALPRRVRRILRPLRAAPRHRARRAGRRARGDLRGARSRRCRAGRRCPRRRRRSSRRVARAPRPMAAGDRRARRRSRRARALDDAFAAAFAGVLARWPSAFRRHRPRPGRQPQAHGNARAQVEELAASLGGPAGSTTDAALSPTTGWRRC